MVIQVENMEKQYSAFRLDCSLTVQEGRVTGLIGQNGAGKSTTFKGILGLITPDRGKIEIFGKDLKEITDKERGQIGVVLSDSGFSGYLMVKDVAKTMAGLYDSFEASVFLEKCRQEGLPLDKKIKEFSTGMRAKLKVLVALSHNTRLLVLDEPTAGLDVVAREEILELLREYMDQDGHSILISSHISTDLEGLCDDLYMIHDGRVVLHEDTDVLLDSYALLKVNAEQYQKLDKKYLLRKKQEGFGYSCLTNRKQFYLENYPGIVVEKGTIDEVISMTIKGEAV